MFAYGSVLWDFSSQGVNAIEPPVGRASLHRASIDKATGRATEAVQTEPA